MLTRACSVFVKVTAMAMLVITAVGAGCGGGSGNKTGTGGTTSAAGGSSFSTGGQGGGDGGSGGTGGSGNGGTHTTGGAAGGATGGTYATGGTGGDLSMDPTEVCRAAIQAQAERMTACLGQDTVDSYMRSAQACPEYVFNPDSNRTVQDVADCLPALLARTCTDVAAAVMPACYANGKRDSGAGCAFASQCKNGVCNGGGQSCGVCYAGGKPAGSACQFWYECTVPTAATAPTTARRSTRPKGSLAIWTLRRSQVASGTCTATEVARIGQARALPPPGRARLARATAWPTEWVRARSARLAPRASKALASFQGAAALACNATRRPTARRPAVAWLVRLAHRWDRGVRAVPPGILALRRRSAWIT